VDYAKSKGIHVINTPASSSESVAEWSLLIYLWCFYHDSNRYAFEGDTNFEGLKKPMQMDRVKRKTLGIVGIGRIGQATAKMALGLGMKVIAADSFIPQVDVTVGSFF
jgi:D-3-phosphoglycerate dehydrogenase